MMSEKKFFQIASYGRTATYWLAACINKHPDVLCSHGGVLPPSFQSTEQPDDEIAVYAHKTQAKFAETPIDEVFDQLVQAGEARAYGMVHAYVAHHLVTRPQVKGHRYPVTWINVVRHPLTRAESLARRIHYEARFSQYTANLVAGPYEVYVPKSIHDRVVAEGGDLSLIPNRAFLYALCFIPAIDRLDFAVPIPQVTMETLTRDPETFAWVFNHITQNAVPTTASFLDEVFSTNRMNHQAEEKSAVARFESWEPWKREAARLVAKRMDFTTLYQQFLYDFSFLN